MQAAEQKFSRNYLKSFANGVAHMFFSSAEHYAWLAHHYGIPRVTIDLLNLVIEPTEFDIRRNRILAGMCRDSLLRNAKRLTPPGAMVAARLVADFGIYEHEVDECGWESIGASTITVIVTDDRGKEWHGSLTVETMGVSGSGFGDPNR